MKNIEIMMETYIDECKSNWNSDLEKADDLCMAFYEIHRRARDIMLSLIGLFFGIPLIVIFGAAVVLETQGSVLYSQERVGRNGKIFKIYKLRSMVCDAEKDGAQWAKKNDSRVTKVGKFIRQTRIDEVPQLFNVLKGDMSLVGPRPERPEFTIQFNEEIPGFIDRLEVIPGLTGWAQVNGGYDIEPKEKLEADIYYIKNRSIKLDFIIILKTMKVVFTGEGAR